MATDNSPLWCANNEPHGEHSRTNRWSGQDYCSGRTAPLQPVVEANDREALAYAICSAPTLDVEGPDGMSMLVTMDILEAFRVADLALAAGFHRTRPGAVEASGV